MIDSIYFEDSIAQHPRTKEFFKRFPQATQIPCSNYKEVFNPSGQSFRIQKKNPALILAEKKGNFADSPFFLEHPLCTYRMSGQE